MSDPTKTRRVLAISGSLRRDSFNTRLLAAATRALPTGIEVDTWDDLDRIPAFNEDLEGGPTPPAVADLRRRIEAADAVLIATPEYNGSVPGQLKNAVDWASRPRGSAALAGVRVAVISASPSPRGAAWANGDLRRILGVAGAEVVDREVAVPSVHERFADDEIIDVEVADDLAALADALVDCVRPLTAAAC